MQGTRFGHSDRVDPQSKPLGEQAILTGRVLLVKSNANKAGHAQRKCDLSNTATVFDEIEKIVCEKESVARSSHAQPQKHAAER